MLARDFSVKLKNQSIINERECKNVIRVLQDKGFIIIKNFFNTHTICELVRKADECLIEGYNVGYSNFSEINSKKSKYSIEFHHPFFISKAAVSLVMNPYLMNVIKKFLKSNPLIHHALFQKTFPSQLNTLDWHIDLGSNKTLNGSRKFKDKRIRMIVYLSEVNNGGLNYIAGSHKNSLKHFFDLPDKKLFPKDKVPTKKSDRIHLVGNPGDIILFDTHGLHKPGLLKNERKVLNVWFCRNDFKGKVSPTLIDIGNVEKKRYKDLGMFSGSTNFSGRVFFKKKKSFVNLFSKKLYGIKKFLKF